MFFSDFVNGQGRKNFQQNLGKKENLFFAGIVWSQVLFAPFEFLVIHPFAAALFVLAVFYELSRISIFKKFKYTKYFKYSNQMLILKNINLGSATFFIESCSLLVSCITHYVLFLQHNMLRKFWLYNLFYALNLH